MPHPRRALGHAPEKRRENLQRRQSCTGPARAPQSSARISFGGRSAVGARLLGGAVLTGEERLHLGRELVGARQLLGLREQRRAAAAGGVLGEAVELRLER